MVWLWILVILSGILNIALLIGVFNLIRSSEFLEDRIFWFYDECNNILRTARMLDEKEMFEKDDEVGLAFEQLIDVIGTLRILIYGTETEEEQHLLDDGNRTSHHFIQR